MTSAELRSLMAAQIFAGLAPKWLSDLSDQKINSVAEFAVKSAKAIEEVAAKSLKP